MGGWVSPNLQIVQIRKNVRKNGPPLTRVKHVLLTFLQHKAGDGMVHDLGSGNQPKIIVSCHPEKVSTQNPEVGRRKAKGENTLLINIYAYTRVFHLHSGRT